MTAKKETVATTKDADRLPFVWLTLAKRVKDLKLPGLKVESMGDKDFKLLGDDMTKSKKSGVWEWTFDFESFAFEFHLLVGSKSTPLAGAKMNVVEMVNRKAILDNLRNGTELVTQGEIDKYFKTAQERAEKSSEIKTIDKQIQDELDSIDSDTKFVAGLAKSVEALDRGQRQMDLMPIGDKIRLGGYVKFLYSLDGDFQVYGLMTYFAKDSKELLNFPSAIAEKLRQDYADGKGKPDFTAARKIVVGVIDNKIMPAYRKSMTDESAESVRKHRANIVALQAKRAKELAKQ